MKEVMDQEFLNSLDTRELIALGMDALRVKDVALSEQINKTLAKRPLKWPLIKKKEGWKK